jgi:hypothetical protein
MTSKKAHWYIIIQLNDNDALDSHHQLVFPSLSLLTNIDEEMMCLALHTCGLLYFRRGTGYSPMVSGWQDFLSDYFLEEVKVSHYLINRKKRYYTRIGSWNSDPQRTPKEIWSKDPKDAILHPRLCIISLGNDLVKVFGEMGLVLFTDATEEEDRSTQ